MRTLIRSIFLVILCALAFLSAWPLIDLQGPRDTDLVQGNPQGEALRDALLALSEDERKRLEQREIAALSSNLLDSRALFNLSVLAGLRKDETQAQKLTLLLSQYSLRNSATQFAAMNLHFVNKDYAAALVRVDSVLRANPGLTPEVLPALYQLLPDNEAARREIIATLKNDPPWRAAFVNHVLKTDPTGQTSYLLLSAMRKAEVPRRDSELRPVVNTLIKSGKIDDAYFIWLDFLSPDDLRKVGRVFDGGFTIDPRNMQFDWSWQEQKNLQIKMINKPGNATDRALNLDFFEFQSAFAGVSQLLRLAPGEYVASFETMAENFKAEGGLQWRVRCLSNQPEIGKSATLLESGPWEASSFAFTVPLEGCNIQILRLEMASRATLDRQVSGRISFDNFKIDPKASPPPPAE